MDTAQDKSCVSRYSAFFGFPQPFQRSLAIVTAEGAVPFGAFETLLPGSFFRLPSGLSSAACDCRGAPAEAVMPLGPQGP